MLNAESLNLAVVKVKTVQVTKLPLLVSFARELLVKIKLYDLVGVVAYCMVHELARLL
jgi:hypothetical protein